ncbi:2-dehydro-3-deoxygalactonokinase [Pseudoxanthomonas beigongshangi]
MSHSHADSIVGINWGSSNFRAYLIAADGRVIDTLESAAGITTLAREGMIDVACGVRDHWPDASAVYAAGMIGSNIGWVDAGYVDCPADMRTLGTSLVPARIGELSLHIVPGLACVREADGASDIMRGEETELFGLLAADRIGGAPVVALPGTHTKWVRLRDGRVHDFMTAMSGEIHDRLSATGLLASVVEGPGHAGPAFEQGVRAAATRSLGLGALLFGVRARVIRGTLQRAEASAYLRGLLIGSEIADALALFPELRGATVPLVGSAPVCALYRVALAALGVASVPVASADAVVRGFAGLHALRG